MSMLLREIWQNQPISRTELVERTGLTSGTITNLTKELIQYKLIYEAAASSSSVGRKRMKLHFSQERYRLIGIDIGRSGFDIVMTDLTGMILKKARETTKASSPDFILKKIHTYLKPMCEQVLADGRSILGIGVGIPGPIDVKKGILLSPPNFPGWDQYPIRSELESEYHVPVFIEDDARVGALAERWFGKGKDGRDLVYVTIGMGIGSGIISNGELVRGANGLYGHVGHMTLVPDGDVCECGNRGCWETVGTIPNILKRWNELRNQSSSTFNDFCLAIEADDTSAQICLNETISYIESALVSIFNVCDPELIVVGGPFFSIISRFEEIRNRVRSRIYTFAKDKVIIEPSSFTSLGVAIGGVGLVLGEIITDPLDILEKTIKL